MSTLGRGQAVIRLGIAVGMLVVAALPGAANLRVAYSDDGDIKVYDVEARRHTTLTQHRARDVVPSWSGDGRRLAFMSDRNGPWDIYTMNADGSDIRQRTHTVRMESGTAFSPDGRHIAFGVARGDAEEYPPIAVLNLATGAARFVTKNTGSQVYRIGWFPDSERILFSRRGKGFGVYQVRVDGAADEQFLFRAHYPSLSPDGSRFAYLRGSLEDTEIRIRNTETSGSKVLPVDVPPGHWPSEATWAGPEKMLVMDSLRDVHLVDVATGEDRPMPPLPGWWLRVFDTAHPWDVSARGKKPFTWGWLKSLNAARPSR